MSPGIERPWHMEFLCVVVLEEAKADKGDPAGCSGERVTVALSCLGTAKWRAWKSRC